jgi:UDP-N-acetylmuramoyl-tripeptide--D-alanyl-D-alanine ligase
MDNKNITVSEILEICNGKLISGNKDLVVNSYSKDSRDIEIGDMYLGIKGERVNGNKYIADSFENGAMGCITDDEINEDVLKKYTNKVIIKVKDTIKALQEIAKYKRNLYDIPVIAVTGSVGKTSTKDIIANVISQKFNVLKTEGNLNNHIGLPLTLLKLKDHTAVVVEMGMNHLGEISLLTDIAKPTGCVITNIGTSHIGNLGSRENILKAKLEILEGLDKNGFVLINNDNDLLNEWKKKEDKYKVYTYGIENKSDYVAEDIVKLQDCSSFIINGAKTKVPVGGTHFIYNSTCAFAIGTILGIEKEKIIKGISEFKLTAKRMDIQIVKDNIKVINDSYNASYDSMKAALEVMGKTEAIRKIAVLGNMLELGEYTKELHEKVGEEVVKNNIDILVTVGEYAKEIANKAKILGIKNITKFEDINSASRYIKNIMKNGDLILLKASNSMNFSKILDDIKE